MQAYIAEFIDSVRADWPQVDCMVVSFSGSDFRCPYGPADLLEFKQEYLVDVQDIKQQMSSSTCQFILFDGGEPCLQRQALLALARYAKSLRLKIILKTNGSNPNTLRSLLKDGLVDYVSLEIPAPFHEDIFQKVTQSKTFFIQPSEIIENIRTSIALLKTSDLDVLVTTSVVPGLMFRKEDLEAIAREIQDLRCTWTLHPFSMEDNLLDKMYLHIEPPSDKFLHNLKEHCMQKYPGLHIEVRPLQDPQTAQ